ncbi:MAG: VIT1/CCC1 transporter family protein [Gammaproteobacteria bacterium]
MPEQTPPLENWREEKQAAYLYRLVAQREQDEEKARLFLALAQAAETQAAIWARKLQEAGIPIPGQLELTPRIRIVAWLIKVFGPRAIRPILAAMKVRGLSIYSPGMISAGHPMPSTVEEVGYRHSTLGGGGNLRAAVFGVNDGLVSNASLVLGVAGATANPDIILMSGIAGLIAGAASMAAGEYVSVRSQRELYEYQIRLEREELEQYPEEEAEELALIYNARGIDMEEARRIATDMLKDPEHALDTLAREELGLNPDGLGSPLGAAAASFVSFALGALLPLLPFLYGGSTTPILYTILISAASLFGVGALLSLFTGHGAIRGGLRMVLIGGGAGLLTWFVGTLLGVSIL